MTFEQTVQIALVTAAAAFFANFIFGLIKVRFDLFEEKTKFTKIHYYDNLTNLYLELYAIIAQSEYVRYFYEIEGDFSELPFFEISSRKIEQKLELKAGAPLVFKTSEAQISDGITEFNKEKIQQLILDRAKHSSQKLLKLAVAHRYVARHYTDKTIEPKMLDKFQVEEVILIKSIVETIVKETNLQLKKCHMDYNSDELSTGILVNGIVD